MTEDKNRYFPFVFKLTAAVSLPLAAVGTVLWVAFGNTNITVSSWLGFAAVIVAFVLPVASKYAMDVLHQELTQFYSQQRLSLAIELRSLVSEETVKNLFDRASDDARTALDQKKFVLLNLEHQFDEVGK